jgi:CubicO group peptidase (beta-lactamase class C family)
VRERLEKIIQDGFNAGIFTEADLSFRFSAPHASHMSFSKGRIVEVYERRLFDIASVTKMIVTLLVYRLLTIGHNGEFTIDAPVNRFIDISGPHTDDLTIYDLMTFHAEFNKFITPAEMFRKIRRRKGLGNLKVFPEMLQQIKSVGLTGRPGVNCRYANVHTILLGLVLESAFGKGLGELIKEHLLAPLGLSDTTADPMGKLHRCVQSHHKVPLGRPSDSVAHFSLRAYSRLLGSAGLFSTTSDLLCILDMALLGDQHPTCYIRDAFAGNLHQPVTEAKNFGQGFGLWSEFLKNLESFHPDPPHDLVFRSGFSGVVCACSKSANTSFAIATNFNHKRRTRAKTKADRRALHKIYARIANCVFDGW